MHYYEHNIKDYRADAFQLTLIQHGAYRQLMDQYYLKEVPLPLQLEDLFNDLLIRGDDEKNTTLYILGKFFDKTEDGYVHKRCRSVIQEFKAKADKNRDNANTRWNKVKNANAYPNECDRNANKEPLTINNKQKTKVSTPEGVDEHIWQDYLKVRSAKRSPITETALKGIMSEAKVAGKTLNEAIKICCENNWIGFKAEWLNRDKNGAPKPKEVWGK